MMGKKKARFLRAWRQKKTDSDLRTSIKGYSVTLALNHALDMVDYIKTEEVSNNQTRKLTTKIANCASYLVFKHYYTEKQGHFKWHENLSRAVTLSVLCHS